MFHGTCEDEKACGDAEASAFAKVSDFAKAMADKSADRAVRKRA